MRAVTYDSYAPDDSKLHYGEVADPKVGPGQVLIQVKAAGINPGEAKIRAGLLHSRHRTARCRTERGCATCRRLRPGR